MIASFSHSGLSSLFITGRTGPLQTDEDRRCVAILDLLASLRADEALPGWLCPACLFGTANGYCVPVSSRLFLAFGRNGSAVTDIRLVSAAFEVPGRSLEGPACLERRPSHPGTIFRTLFLPTTGLSVAAVGRSLGSPPGTLYKFFTGDRRAVGTLALGLARLTGTSDDFWPRLQSAHDVFVHGRSITQNIPLSAILNSIEAGPCLRRGRRISGHVQVSRAM
jgi:plasmid maintenance system antidote protein VapI